MTRSAALARVGPSSRRWLLPWIAVLLVSATLAYAMNSAIAGGASASDQPADVGTLAPEPRAAISGGPMHVGVDWWIVVERRKLACEPGEP
jgi:hypothetical protein